MVLVSTTRRRRAQTTTEVGLGSRVWSNAFDNGKKWYPGTITDVNSKGVVVTFDEGGESILLSKWSVRTSDPDAEEAAEEAARVAALEPTKKRQKKVTTTTTMCTTTTTTTTLTTTTTEEPAAEERPSKENRPQKPAATQQKKKRQKIKARRPVRDEEQEFEFPASPPVEQPRPAVQQRPARSVEQLRSRHGEPPPPPRVVSALPPTDEPPEDARPRPATTTTTEPQPMETTAPPQPPPKPMETQPPKEATIVKAEKQEKGRQREVVDLTGDDVAVTMEAEPSEDEPPPQEDDDGVVVTSSTMSNALAEYPHSRKDCGRYPVGTDPLLFCAQCYCYVCEVKASECRAWKSHCHATSGVKLWQIERILTKHRAPGTPWNVGRCMEAISDVITREPTKWSAGQYMPNGDKRQHQIFGRMLGRERATNKAAELTGRRTVENSERRRALVTGGWIVLGDRQAASQGIPFDDVLYPIGTLIRVCKMPDPPPHQWDAFLRAIVANSRGIDDDVQRGPSSSSRPGDHRGGPQTTNNQEKKVPAMRPRTLIDLTATVIVTENVGIWQNALGTHLGPSGRIYVVDNPSSLRRSLVQGFRDLRRLDAIIARPTAVQQNRDVFGLAIFHRLIVDRPTSQAAFVAARLARAYHVWLLAPLSAAGTNPIAGYEDHLRVLGAWESRVSPSTITTTEGPRSFAAFASSAARSLAKEPIAFAGDDHSTLVRLFHAWVFRYKRYEPFRSAMELHALVGTPQPPRASG